MICLVHMAARMISLRRAYPDNQCPVQAIDGVPKISQDYNPATWMLEITNTAVENRTGQDFAALYAQSDMNKCAGRSL